MTPQRWIIAGWVLMAAVPVFGGVSLVQALDSVHHDMRILPVNPPPAVDAGQLLGAVILAVIAGVAFFSGLACFFWSAMLESRQQTARILEALRPPH